MNQPSLTIVGNVVESPEWRVVRSGASMATFRVAAAERRFDADSGRWVDGDRLFLRVTCWRQLADNVRDSLRGGDPVIVTGRLAAHSYEVEGKRRWSTGVVASTVGHDLARGAADFRRTPARADPSAERCGAA